MIFGLLIEKHKPLNGWVLIENQQLSMSDFVTKQFC
jgi:hypothetical protein